ncbi:MAG: site-specific integrase [Candidatus Gastranaerophilales bacterium]
MNIVEPIRSKSEIRKVEKILEKQNKRNLLIFTIGTNCGLRISDILALDVGDVKNKTYIQITEKKTGKYKKFPINAKLKPMLDEFTENRELEEPLFISSFNKRLGRVMSYFIINQACRKAGIEASIGTHTLRKTFGYHHYKKFKDVVMLQKIFNHSSPQITLRYIGIEQDEINDSYTNFIL